MELNQRLRIEDVAEDGEPTAPRKNAQLFVAQCGVIVRDTIPITIQEWNKPKKADGVTYVEDRCKDELWNTLMTNFTLPEEVDPDNRVIEQKVKAWALKKMADQFKNHKKRLHRDYVLKKKTPEFTGAYEKLKDHWAEFMAYKKSAEAVKRSTTNKINAAKKKYHHVTGTGGYKTNMLKWEKAENDLLAKGITPETSGWIDRAKDWFYGHGGSLHPETGKCVYTKGHLAKPFEGLKTAHQDVQEGKFHPERENDELTRALGNAEHSGRTRGTYGSLPWKYGFAEDRKRYPDRSRERRKARNADRMQRIEETLRMQQEQINVLSQQGSGPSQRQRDADPALDATSPPSQRKSSVASTEFPADDDAVMLAPRYPVDDITESCM